MSEQTQRRLFKLITGEVVFGEYEVIQNENGQDVLIKTPYTAMRGQAIPYMYDVLGQAPGAIQIHPINILWSVELDEFEEINAAYIKATTGIDLAPKSGIITGL